MRTTLQRAIARVSLRCLLSVLALAAGTPQAAAAQQSTARADSLFARGSWREAADAYERVTKADPNGGQAWMQLGESYLKLHRLDDALAAYATAERLKFRPWMNVVNQARVMAEKRDDAQVLALVQRVITAGVGGSLRPYVLGASEFGRLANDARWKALIAQLSACGSEPYRQFDFWIGDWDVYLAAGGLAGHNSVTREQDGCVLVEHWTGSGGGSTGTSFNYYDVRDQRWHQLYLDNSGNAGAFPAMAGALQDGKMVMLTDDTNNTLSRWTWYVMSPGKVKQMAELSKDHGKTWQITWNSVYVKRGESP